MGKPLKRLVYIRAADRDYGSKLLSTFMAFAVVKKDGKKNSGKVKKEKKRQSEMKSGALKQVSPAEATVELLL